MDGCCRERRGINGRPGFRQAAETPRDEETGRFQYQEVVEVENASAGELYSRAKAWIATAYRSANDVIQLDDSAQGRLIAKGKFSITYYMESAWIRHTLTIEVKDGRFRYTLSEFQFDNGHWSAPLEDEKKFTGQRRQLFRQVVESSEEALRDLESAMRTTGIAGDDDW